VHKRLTPGHPAPCARRGTDGVGRDGKRPDRQRPICGFVLGLFAVRRAIAAVVLVIVVSHTDCITHPHSNGGNGS
jgi:hypothetical protein